jgi:hypothetical protein
LEPLEVFRGRYIFDRPVIITIALQLGYVYVHEELDKSSECRQLCIPLCIDESTIQNLHLVD